MIKKLLLSLVFFNSIALSALPINQEYHDQQMHDQDMMDAAQGLLMLGTVSHAVTQSIPVAPVIEQEEDEVPEEAGGGAALEAPYTFTYCTLCTHHPVMDRMQLIDHVIEHHKGLCPFPDCVPSKNFKGNSRYNYNKHFKSHEEHFVCDTCHEVCKTAGSLRIHKQRKHTSLKAYKCPIKGCPREMQSESIIFDHLQDMHSIDGKGWGCPGCAHRGGSYQLVKEHIRQKHVAAIDTFTQEIDQRTSLMRTLSDKLKLRKKAETGDKIAFIDLQKTAYACIGARAADYVQQNDSDDDSSYESDDNDSTSSSASSSSSDGSIEVIIKKRKY